MGHSSNFPVKKQNLTSLSAHVHPLLLQSPYTVNNQIAKKRKEKDEEEQEREGKRSEVRPSDSVENIPPS